MIAINEEKKRMVRQTCRAEMRRATEHAGQAMTRETMELISDMTVLAVERMTDALATVTKTIDRSEGEVVLMFVSKIMIGNFERLAQELVEPSEKCQCAVCQLDRALGLSVASKDLHSDCLRR